jgi:hypothetical protein
MTGSEHYKKAEEILARRFDQVWKGAEAELLAEAQVHATLALVAATAMGGAERCPDARLAAENTEAS